MNDSSWPTATDPLAMLEKVFPMRGLDSVQPQSRKSRLYLFACARQAWPQLPGVCQAVVKLAERVYSPQKADRVLYEQVYPHAEALIQCRGVADAVNEIGRALVDLGHATAAEVWATEDVKPDLWTGFAYLAYYPFDSNVPHFPNIPLELHSAELLREVFGNPFLRPPPFDPNWRTETVRQLAPQAANNLSLLPVLADALQDAGCDEEELLDHLRRGGPHARGCWALERVLTEPAKPT